MLYLGFKLLHVLAVVIFLGNIITGVFWKAQADRSKEPRVMLNMLEGLIRSDQWFTIPGVVAILIGGVGSSIIGGYPILGTGWIFWSIVLFTVSGLAFMFGVAPLQKQLAQIVRQGIEVGQFDHKAYEKISRAWDIWGAISLLTPIIVVGLMVFKPTLPAF
jgi:uncharacterized membrane protein